MYAGMNGRRDNHRFMLSETLGCPNTFEFRRQELQLLRLERRKASQGEEIFDASVENNASSTVSDETVLASFLAGVETTHSHRYGGRFRPPLHQWGGFHDGGRGGQYTPGQNRQNSEKIKEQIFGN